MERITTALRLCVLLIPLFKGIILNAQVVYVDQSATGTGDGSSWVNAMTDLQTAIDAAASIATSTNPIQVWVAAGTYYPTTGMDRTISFVMKNSVEIYGGFDGSESLLSQRDYINNQTILSGDIGTQGDVTDNSYNVISNSNFPSSPLTSSAILDGFTIRDGYMTEGTLTGGAGMRNNNSSPTVRFCIFINNSAPVINPTLGGGGAILNTGESNPAIIGCTFRNNYSWRRGGAIAFASPSSVFSHTVESQIINCVFYQNSADDGGGAIWIYRYKVNITNCTFVENSGTKTSAQGGAIAMNNANNAELSSLSNNIFWNNSAAFEGSQIYFFEQFPTTDPVYGPNLVDGGTGGISGGLDNIGLTISDDPLFIDQSNGNLSIAPCSPAVDIGDNSHVTLSVDVNNNPRIFSGTVDLGAFENQFMPISIAAAEIQDVSCFSGTDGQISVNAGGGTGGAFEYSIDGSNFNTTGLFENLSPGSYTVTVRESGISCSITENYTINEPSALNVSYTTDDVLCNGDFNGEINITASGGSAPYTVFVLGTSFGQFTSTKTVGGLGARSYPLLVRDANGCEFSDSFTIGEPAALSASSSVTNVLCAGESTGQIDVAATGGTAPYEFSIDGTNFQTSSQFTELAMGSYTITVVDDNLCSTQLTTTVSGPAPLVINISSTNAQCEGGAQGTFSIIPSGGTSPYDFKIGNLPVQTGPSIGGSIPAGSYDVLVTDANGCQASKTLVVENDVVIVPSEVAVTATSCNNSSDGIVEVTATGGLAPYTYSKDQTTFQSSGQFTGMTGGGYLITVKDANGCMASLTGTIPSPDALSLQADATGLTCFETNDGSISITPSGGTSPYQFSLDGINFQSGSEFNGLSQGTYTIIVRDANSCQASATVTISEPDELLLSTSVSSKEVTLSATGGTAPYEYSIDEINYQSSNVFSSLEVGSYTFFVRDANGCEAQSEVVEIVLGIIKDPSVSIFPNPTSEILEIEGGSFDALEIYNLQGQKVLSSNKRKISVARKIKGIYILRLFDKGKEVHNQKLIIN